MLRLPVRRELVGGPSRVHNRGVRASVFVATFHPHIPLFKSCVPEGQVAVVVVVVCCCGVDSSGKQPASNVAARINTVSFFIIMALPLFVIVRQPVVKDQRRFA
jgi:hypothetical protein